MSNTTPTPTIMVVIEDEAALRVASGTLTTTASLASVPVTCTGMTMRCTSVPSVLEYPS